MKNLKYAEKRIELLKPEMGAIKRVFQSEKGLFIELENGMNLQLHDEEINYQAIEYLESEIEQPRVVKPKFWEFTQNNSGGYYVEDDENGVCESVIIEAQTPDEAWAILVGIGEKVTGFWNYCGCCGERWGNYLDEEDGKDVPMHYGKPLEEVGNSAFMDRAFVHYCDGSIKEFKFK